MLLTRLRTTLVGLGITLGIFIALVAALAGFDLFLHQKFDLLAGLNYRGYRGSVLGQKTPDETRVGLFGGSIAFGYGVGNNASIAAFLERGLNERAKSGSRYRVANLASNGEPYLSAFKANYELFRYLDLDILLFYVCGEDFSGTRELRQSVYSERSSDPVMRSVGYYFILPLVVREKYYLLKYGSVQRGYAEQARNPGWFEQRLLERTKSLQSRSSESLQGFLQDVVRGNKTVVLALCPGSAVSRNQYQEVLTRTVAGISRVSFVDLKDVFPPGEQSSYFVDGLHYSEKGNRVIGEALARRYIRP